MNEHRASQNKSLASGTMRSADPKDSGAPLRTGPVATGDVVNGRYLVLREIGIGGAGIVYAARNIELDEQVALKFLRPEAMAEPGIVARFAREAKAAVSIKSEYVATVHDVGMTPDGLPFLVMEHLEGRDLAYVIADRKTLPVREAAEYTLQICEALAIAHSKDIIHRDIKPENLMLTERASGMHIIKVLDFGISKAALTGQMFGENLPLVTTSNLMGTPLYMSPEQVRCQESIDERSDIWSLGVVLYEMVTGASPFPGATVPEICSAILEREPITIERFRTDLPDGLAEVIYRCLCKSADERYPNIAELAMAILPFAPSRARLCVERSISVLAAAGLIGDHVRLESWGPPARPSGTTLISEVPRSAPLPKLPDSSRRAFELGVSAPPAMVLSGAPEPLTPPKRPLRQYAFAALTLACIGAGVVASMPMRATSSPHERVSEVPAEAIPSFPATAQPDKSRAPLGLVAEAPPKPLATVARLPSRAVQTAQVAPAAHPAGAPASGNKGARGPVPANKPSAAHNASSGHDPQVAPTTPTAVSPKAKSNEPDLGY
jgi:eukaryotic-like serine/threonine-protein kinase